ncbi:MAG TPA: hypothetical protein VD948_08925, partial [Rhodothermales bacterium]|nr:hypothetical protein [Rhodothermales bacterium]
MNISLSWLAEYVRHGLTDDEVAAALTLSGLEVEDVQRIGGDVPASVVVGQVLETARHPDADRLTLCRVDVGAGDALAIVCGAPNVAPGQKVAVAPPGTTLELPGKDGTRTAVTLERRKIRGQVSEGMICAEDELGLGDDHSGILVLDADARVGEPLSEYLARHGHRPDTVLTLNVTPNRPDATSHVGVARDLAALAQVPLRLPDVAPPGTTLQLPGKDGTRTAVTLERRKIRGQVSEGMICAEDELGLGDDHSGILVL